MTLFCELAPKNIKNKLYKQIGNAVGISLTETAAHQNRYATDSTKNQRFG